MPRKKRMARISKRQTNKPKDIHHKQHITTRHVQKYLRLLGVLFLVFGTIMYVFYNRTILTFETSATTFTEPVSRAALPTQITIKSAHIDVPIAESQIVQGIWQINPKGASHLYVSGRPQEANNIVIYGHNKNSIFGGLKNVQTGDIIQIRTNTEREFRYQVYKKSVVKPSDITAVLPTNQELLTVYTCTGFLDSQRLVLQARPL